MASSPRYPAGARADAAPDWLCDGKLQSITQLVLCDGNLAACLQAELNERSTGHHMDITGSAGPARRHAGSGARTYTSVGT